MARKVFVSEDIGRDEALMDCAQDDPEAAMLWPWLLPLFDDWGRASADCRRIKAAMFAFNDVISLELIDRALGLFADYGLLSLYEDDGRWYMAVDPDAWWSYQTHIRREKRDTDGSRIPAPPTPPSATERARARRNGKNPASPHYTTLPPTPHRVAPAKRARLTEEESTNRDGVWTALADLFGEPSESTRKLRGKLVRDLLKAGGTYSEIKERAKAWPKLFPPRTGQPVITLTDTALEKWWGQLGKICETGKPAPDCGICGNQRMVGVTEDGEIVALDSEWKTTRRCSCVGVT